MSLKSALNDKLLTALYNIADKMEVGQVITVSEIAPNKPKEFIECVKFRINHVGDLEFNSDYTKVKKNWRLKDLIV